MKLVCEIEIPDNADARTRLDAIANASRHEELWREVRSKDELKKRTDLTNKCGSCEHFRPIQRICGTTCYGKCDMGLSVRQRSTKACKRYRGKDDE